MKIFPSGEALSAALAKTIMDRLECLHESGKQKLTLAISGGQTPLGLLNHLVEHHSQSSVWDKVQLYWVDERYVPFDHPESNYGNARPFVEALGIPQDQLYPMHLEDNPIQAAQTYHQLITTLSHQRGGSTSLFDICLLGIGTDGHVASLFPGTDHLQDGNFCKATTRPETGQARISLTLAALNRSDLCMFMATGASKSEIISVVYPSKPDPRFPASLVQPSGKLVWYIDEAAKPTPS